tara:strand:- start:4109 stop:4696 length:588 start_codon:yes stop_codon:yes gene_type:complete
MPFIGERLGLNTAVSASGTTALLNVDFVKGAFKVYNSSTLVGISPNLFSDNQIIYVEDSASLFKADVVPADFIETFADTVSFSEFSFNSGSFTSASFDGTATLTLFGQNLQGSPQVSMSIDLSALTGSGGGGGGSGDITAVFAGDGLTGGASSGNATLEVDAGLGINLVGGVNIDTGSNHFVGGVQKVEIDGDTF